MTAVLSALAFPEGPAFAPDGSLWCVELKGGALVRLDNHVVERFFVGGEPNGLTFDRGGRPVFCDAASGSIRTLDATLCDGFDRPNDLAFDSAGNLLFTCPGSSRQEPTGYVCCRSAGGEVRRIAEGLYFPNGLAFNGETLYIAETYRQRLWKGTWNPTALNWTNAEPWVETGGPTGPDGIAIDRDGRVFVAVYGQRCIKVFEPSGVLAARLDLPGQNPTNVAFDPSGTLGLVVTEAENGQLLSIPGHGPGLPLYS